MPSSKGTKQATLSNVSHLAQCKLQCCPDRPHTPLCLHTHRPARWESCCQARRAANARARWARAAAQAIVAQMGRRLHAFMNSLITAGFQSARVCAALGAAMRDVWCANQQRFSSSQRALPPSPLAAPLHRLVVVLAGANNAHPPAAGGPSHVGRTRPGAGGEQDRELAAVP